MSIFKRLKGGDHSVDPFEANASQSFEWVSGSSSVDGFSVNLALLPPSDYPNSTDAIDGDENLGGTTDGGFSSYPLFRSVQKFFYIDSASFADQSGYFPEEDMFVWNIGSGYVGNYIKPHTFKITIPETTDFIQDDGSSRLRLNRTGSVVGNVFYNHGISTVRRNSVPSSSISTSGIAIVSASQVNTTFVSSMTIYEHNVTCVLSPMDYTVTVNPSAFVSSSTNKAYNDRINSGSGEVPYVTTVGLFNDYNELLAVAKVSAPITRQKYTDQTFLIKFDE